MPPSEAAPLAPPVASPLAGCDADFTGLWSHSEDDGFRYLARDDGGVLTLESVWTGRDGGSRSSQVVLVRSPGTFVGAVGVAQLQADAGCAALFPVEVVSCADAGLVLATVDRLRVDERCKPLELPTVRRLHRLVRLTPDAGS